MNVCILPNSYVEARNVNVFGNGVPKEVIKIKLDNYGWGPNPIRLVPL